MSHSQSSIGNWIMAQGSSTKSLGKARKSAGSQRRKTVRAKSSLSKGRKHYNTKVQRKVAAQRDETDTTKAINRKNESLIAAKAVRVGTKFFLGDISSKGKKEVEKQNRERLKKQNNSKTSDRLKAQLKKLESKAAAGKK